MTSCCDTTGSLARKGRDTDRIDRIRSDRIRVVSASRWEHLEEEEGKWVLDSDIRIRIGGRRGATAGAAVSREIPAAVVYWITYGGNIFMLCK